MNIIKSLLLNFMILAVGIIGLSCQQKDAGTQKSGSDPLKQYTDQLVFKNAGIVHRDMVFTKSTKKGLYVETDYLYSDTRRSYDYLFEVKDGVRVDPPSGMRSSVPLGGLGAGTVELRGDGGFMDWNIFNNSPATGNEKVQLPNGFMGLWVQGKSEESVASTLRTHPEEGFPAIAQIEYSGAFPVSKLSFSDPEIALQPTLYAYSEFHTGQPGRSASPCAIFSLELHNPTDKPYEAAFLFNLPNYIKGQFQVKNGLILTKEGKEPASGNMTLMATGADQVTYQTGNNLTKLWKDFSAEGLLPENVADENGAFGAISAKAKIAPGATRTITIAMGWYFPELPISIEVVGNYYTNLYKNSADVVRQVLTRLPETWEGILTWNQTCFDNTLPDWLQDAMVNSMATMFKTGIWTKDGRFRQWESFACPNIDPIHIHFARSLPYELFFPRLKQSIIGAHGAAQRENGYIPEKLWPRNTECVLDKPTPGRILGDCSTSFILSVYMTHKWAGDKAFVDKMWPHVKRAAEWQMDRSKRLGLPDRLASTYDLSGFGKKDLVSYNAFMHMAGLQSSIALAKVYGDDVFATRCEESLKVAKKTLRKHLWTGEYFRNWWSEDEPLNDDIHIDSQFGQLWSYLLGLGHTMDPDLMRAHLQKEAEVADSPFGLKVFAYAEKDRDETGSGVNNAVWQAGSIHWSILNLYLGTDVASSLSKSEKLINHWRKKLNDQWNYSDLTSGSDGYPHTNSHYGRQLILWGLPLALTGQDYSASEARLVLNPKMKPPYRLPVFTPHASGLLIADPDKPLRLDMKSGTLSLNELMVNGQMVATDVEMKAGDSLFLDNARP